MRNRVIFNEEAIKELAVGMDIVHKTVAGTLGAAGKNVMYRADNSKVPIVTNDGVSIARRIVLEDETQSMGADAIKQAAERTNEECGDGTTTSIVLAHAMVQKGLELVADGANPMKLKREMEDAVEVVSAKLKAMSKEIKDESEILQVVNISMENTKVAKLIVEAIKKAGPLGEIIVQESSNVGITIEAVPGLSFDKGFIDANMMTDYEKENVVLNDAYVLVTDKQFSQNKDMMGLITELHSKGIKELFVICESIHGEMIGTILANKMKGIFTCVVVERPFDPEVLEDIAILTGAESMTGSKYGGELKPIHSALLGRAGKITVSRTKTTIEGGKGKPEKIAARIVALQSELKTAQGWQLVRAKERLAKLVGGLVTINVGAPTEQDMKYMKLKVDDAVSAGLAAMEEGIVPGGGRALYDISLAKPKTMGEEIVFHACRQPILRIIENSGEAPESIVARLNPGEVWDALEGKVCADPIKAGIIDPTKVERCAVKNAASMAGIHLTLHAAVIDIAKKDIQ